MNVSAKNSNLLQKMSLLKWLFLNRKSLLLTLIKTKTIITPSVLKEFIKNQIKNPLKLKNKNFSKSINLGILKLLKNFLGIYKSNVIGLKILYTGK